MLIDPLMTFDMFGTEQKTGQQARKHTTVDKDHAVVGWLVDQSMLHFV